MENEASKAQIVKIDSNSDQQGKLIVDLIAEKSTLSKSLIKKLMVNGSVFVCKLKKRTRVRKAKSTIKAEERIECFYDPSIPLNQEFEFPLLHSTRHYGVYLKPAGALSQGTDYGDQSSLIRSVEKEKRYAYLVNRLDRETEGLVIVAYDSRTQNLFQEMWRANVEKKYQAIVFGNLEGEGIIDTKMNGKEAETHYQAISTEGNQTNVEIRIVTGRKHQIRIHLSDLGYPVMGDPKYGKYNKNKDGLKLIAYELNFKDPQKKKRITVTIPTEKMLF